MGRDRISELPDPLLTQILSYLPTKDSVKTSVLSKRWQLLWLRVPSLDLCLNDFPKGVLPSFIDGYFKSNRESRMQKLRMSYGKYNRYDYLMEEWIETAVDRGVQHLVVETDTAPCDFDIMPDNIFKSNALVSLKLVKTVINSSSFTALLPCLKSMHLEDIWFNFDPSVIEKLVSGCPVLEDLTLISPADFCQGYSESLCVSSQSLKSFHFTYEDYGQGGADFSVEIDAPRLECLCFKDDQSDSILLKNVGSLFMVDIHTKFSVVYGDSPEDLRKRDTIRGFLTGISTVRQMVISQCTAEGIYRYSEVGTIPKCDSLYRLEAGFSSSMLRFLPVFLESCPNLKSLVLDFAVSGEPEQNELTCVPPCLSRTLECVEIKGLTVKEEAWRMQLANYFLANLVGLKKLILRLEDVSEDFLLTCPNLSHQCQVIFCG